MAYLFQDTARAARRLRVLALFYLNIRSWKNQPFIQEHYVASTIERLEDDLRELVETSTSEGEIEWGLRQLAYDRV